MKQKLLIKKNFYAAKVITDKKLRKIHAISYSACNFACNYCDFSFFRKKETLYKEYSYFSFLLKVLYLRVWGNCFKFTGGEPCMNSCLEKDLRIIKKIHGNVYLDTNSSNPKKIKNFLENDLIDVLAISLKGLSSEEAKKNTGVSVKLCWDNVLETINIASQYKVKTTITYVCNQEFSYDKLLGFAKIIEPSDNIILKINNYQYSERMCFNGWKSADNIFVESILQKFVIDFPVWKNKIIYIPDHSAVQREENILFF